jgi:hypothetical protein
MHKNPDYQNFVLVALSGGLSRGNGSHGAILKLFASSKPIIHDLNRQGGVAWYSACPSGFKAVVALVKKVEYLRKTDPQFIGVGIGIAHGPLPVSMDRMGTLIPSSADTDLENQAMANAKGLQTYQAALDEIIDFIG